MCSTWMVYSSYDMLLVAVVDQDVDSGRDEVAEVALEQCNNSDAAVAEVAVQRRFALVAAIAVGTRYDQITYTTHDHGNKHIY